MRRCNPTLRLWLRCALAATLTTLILSSVGLAQQYLFNRADFATGLSPRQAVLADFNGDGRPDVAVSNEQDNTVAIRLGTASGLFGPQVTFATGGSPYAIAAADFNHDGKLDLAVTNLAENTVSILLGNGDGTFRSGSTPAAAAEPGAVAAADFNKDGRIDLAVANLAASSVSILLGNGDGTFQPQRTFATGSNPRSVAVGDFNGDSKLDLALASTGTNTVSILLGNGDGTFTAGASPQTPARRPTHRLWVTSMVTASWTWLWRTIPSTWSRCCWAMATGLFRRIRISPSKRSPSSSRWPTSMATAKPTCSS